MKFCGCQIPILLALASLVLATNKAGGGDDGGNDASYGPSKSFPDGKKSYISERKKLDPSFTYWDSSQCDGKGPYDALGCCQDVTAVNADLENGWEVYFETPTDADCINIIDKGLDMTWTLKPASTKPTYSTMTFYMTRIGADLNDTKSAVRNQIIAGAPICAASLSLGWYRDTLLAGQADPFEQESMWYVGFEPPLLRGQAEFADNLGTNYHDEDVGSSWISNDCDQLADKIRNGTVKYPPKNRFALAALEKRAGVKYD